MTTSQQLRFFRQQIKTQFMTDVMASSRPEERQVLSPSRKRSFDEVDSTTPDVKSEAATHVAQTTGSDTQMTGVSGEAESEEESELSEVEIDSDEEEVATREVLGETRTTIQVEVRGLPRSNILTPSIQPTSTMPPPSKKAKTTTTAQTKAEREAERAKKAAEKEAEKARKEAEKLAEKQAVAQKKAEKEAEKEAAKEAERIAKEADKAEKEAEKAKKEAEKAAEKARKDAEKAAKEAEKAAKDVEKAARLAEKKQKEEVKIKAERAQMRLGNFFTSTATPKDEAKGVKAVLATKARSSMSPAPSVASNAVTPSKPQVSPYDTIFPSFFVHPDVKVAPFSHFTFDPKAVEIMTAKVDGYLSGEKSPLDLQNFDAKQAFHVAVPGERGRKCMPVREIMDELSGNAKRPIDLTTESQHSQLRRTKDLLARVPVKYLKFAEDVRPPYIGTYTSRPRHGMQSMARNPFRKDLPDQNYEYDSEAEWQEDDEDAEDLRSENDEDEEQDDPDEMAEFLDDEGDEAASSKRLVMQGDLEHTSTGLCWEDKHKKCPNVKLMPYRMEIMIDPKLKSIDPFSTAYWEEPKAMAPPPRVPLSATNSNSKVSSLKSFFTPTSDDQPATSTAKPEPHGKPTKLIHDEDLAAFRAAIVGSPLTGVGLADSLAKQFPKYTAKVVKDNLQYMGQRGRKKGSLWELIDRSD